MFGGPMLGVAAFLVVAILLGWGLISLLQGRLNASRQTLDQSEFAHGFDPETVYLTQHAMLLGYSSEMMPTLVPGKEDLPRDAKGRRAWPTIQQYRDDPGSYPDLEGVVERHTRVQFVEVIDDPTNGQTRILVMVRLLDGPYAGPTTIRGMYLESADIDAESGQRRYMPREELFVPVNPPPSPVQSPAQTNDPNDDDEPNHGP